MLEQERLEIGARQHRELRRLQRHDGGRARLLVQHHFAEVLSRALDREDEPLAVLVRQVDLDPAREDQEKRIALVALADDDRLLGIAA